MLIFYNQQIQKSLYATLQLSKINVCHTLPINLFNIHTDALTGSTVTWLKLIHQLTPFLGSVSVKYGIHITTIIAIFCYNIDALFAVDRHILYQITVNELMQH